MDGNSTNSLWKRAEDMTVLHNQGDTPPAAPPAVAAQSPLHELLLEEVAAALPPEVAVRMRACPSVGLIQDWLAAGAVYSWLANDPYLSRRFLSEVGDQPKLPALALVAAVASRMEPPPQEAAWHRRDYLGLVLQLAATCAFLLCRSLLLYLIRY
jgi:hypothetical protein